MSCEFKLELNPPLRTPPKTSLRPCPLLSTVTPRATSLAANARDDCDAATVTARGGTEGRVLFGGFFLTQMKFKTKTLQMKEEEQGTKSHESDGTESALAGQRGPAPRTSGRGRPPGVAGSSASAKQTDRQTDRLTAQDARPGPSGRAEGAGHTQQVSVLSSDRRHHAELG